MTAEMAKWRNITYAAIAACTGLTVYDLFISPEEHHHHEKKVKCVSTYKDLEI
jgi:hypothetical protein